MEYILNADEMRLADNNTSRNMHVSELVLMERAALSMLKVLEERGLIKQRILIVCGPGNNGADGLCLARLLAEREIYADICLPGGTGGLKGAGKEQYLSLKALKNDIAEYTEIDTEKSYGLVVDALFGISLNRPLEGNYLKAVKAVNLLKDKGSVICAVDIPSGINASDAHVMGMAVYCDITVTFAFKKIGNVLYPGAQYCGEVICTDIGITKKALVKKPAIFALGEEDIALPERIRYSNKGTYGKVLLIAGSENMAGAAVLCTLAALKSGCGMARVYTQEKNRVILQETVPEAIVTGYTNEEPLKGIEECLKWCDVIAVGPGLSQSEPARIIVRYILENADVPMVIDADALNIIADDPDILSGFNRNIVITPHVGEMSRLTGIQKRDISDHLPETAADFAKSYNVVCALKDARTVIADETGRICVNINGNSGMATAGSGDVLTGIVSSLLAQGTDPFKAAYTACAVHGRAGDAAAGKLTEAGVLARDIINEIR